MRNQALEKPSTTFSLDFYTSVEMTAVTPCESVSNADQVPDTLTSSDIAVVSRIVVLFWNGDNAKY
jgi:hypothetical protein